MLNSLAQFWDKGTPQKVAVVATSIGASLVCACLGLVVLVTALPGGGKTSTPSSAQATKTATKATSTSTVLVAGTPTATPSSQSTATTITHPETPVLGATGAAFITKFGQPNDHSTSTSLHFARYSGSNVDGLIVSLGLNNGTPPRAYDVLASAPPSQLWNMTAARTTCEQYRPTDAASVQRMNVLDSSNALVGEDDIFSSATLASEFPANLFLDANTNPTTPGTFDIFYLYETANDASRINSCSLDLGSSQTKAP